MVWSRLLRLGDVCRAVFEICRERAGNKVSSFSARKVHKQKVTSLINNLMDIAVSEKDYAAQSRLQWFIDEQVEEEENATDIIQKLKLLDGNSYGMYVLDQELAARTYVQAAPLATAE